MNMKSFLAAVATAVAVSTGTRAEESPLVLFTAVSGRPGKAEAADIVRRSRAAGFSQWVVYPRSGLELEYMGEEWLSFVGAFLAEARAQGGHVWLYDEYNWPSGSCKGRVPSTKGVAPFMWQVPKTLVGTRARLEIELTTSVRPAFGRAPIVRDHRGRLISGGRDCVSDVRLAQPPWCATIQDCDRGGLLAGEWRRTPTP